MYAEVEPNFVLENAMLVGETEPVTPEPWITYAAEATLLYP
jgi:hypothetical protein